MILYHYCSNEAFHSIISNREIRLSSLSLSNDSMEGKLIERVLLEMAEKDGFNNEQIERLQEKISRLGLMFDGLGFCLSEKKDLLSQWRGYASDAHGVSIGFSKKYLELLSASLNGGKKSGFSLQKVIYKPDEHVSALNPTYQKIKEHLNAGAFKRPAFKSILATRSEEEIEKENKKIMQETSGLLMSLFLSIGDLYSLKSMAFEEEFEWRLVSLLVRDPAIHLDPCLFHPCLNKIMPYRSFRLIDLKANPIEKIVLGPRNSTPKDVIDSFLRQNNFNNVEVLISKASYI